MQYLELKQSGTIRTTCFRMMFRGLIKIIIAKDNNMFSYFSNKKLLLANGKHLNMVRLYIGFCNSGLVQSLVNVGHQAFLLERLPGS